jgi:hypothetical protein
MPPCPGTDGIFPVPGTLFLPSPLGDRTALCLAFSLLFYYRTLRVSCGLLHQSLHLSPG